MSDLGMQAIRAAVDALLMAESNAAEQVPDGFVAAVSSQFGPLQEQAIMRAIEKGQDAAGVLGVTQEFSASRDASEASVRSISGDAYALFAGAVWVAAAVTGRLAAATGSSVGDILRGLLEDGT